MAPSWRFYAQVPHSRRTEEYKDFRKGLSAMRIQIQEEENRRKRMLAEDSTSEAAQDARKEREREAKALKNNKIELRRMAEKRQMKPMNCTFIEYY